MYVIKGYILNFLGGGELEKEKPFEREVLDRLITMETKIDTIAVQCPQCQSKVGSHAVALATVDASTKSAHHRIDGIYKTVGIASSVIGTVIGFIFTLLNFVLHKGG